MRNQLGDGGATAAVVRQSIDAVAAASGGAIAVHEVPLVIEPRRAGAVADGHRRPRRAGARRPDVVA